MYFRKRKSGGQMSTSGGISGEKNLGHEECGKRSKNLKKGVDKRGGFCYYRQALPVRDTKSPAAEAVEEIDRGSNESGA